MTLHIGQPEPPCHPCEYDRDFGCVHYSPFQVSKTQLRSPMEHCWGVLEPILDLIDPERGLRLRKASKEELATLI